MHVAGIMPRNVADINVNTFKFSNPETMLIIKNGAIGTNLINNK
jgi:hypothetical protein